MYLLAFDPILTIAAIVPAVVLLVMVYKADKLDKEPRGLLIKLIFLGIISTMIAVVLETIGQYVLSPTLGEHPVRGDVRLRDCYSQSFHCCSRPLLLRGIHGSLVRYGQEI